MFQQYGYVYILWELSGRRESEMDLIRSRTIPYIFNRLVIRKEVTKEMEEKKPR